MFRDLADKAGQGLGGGPGSFDRRLRCGRHGMVARRRYALADRVSADPYRPRPLGLSAPFDGQNGAAAHGGQCSSGVGQPDKLQGVLGVFVGRQWSGSFIQSPMYPGRE